MLLLRYRTPIKGSDHTLKISMSTIAPEWLIRAQLNVILKNKKWNEMLLQGSRTLIQGSDHTLKISMSSNSTWTID